MKEFRSLSSRWKAPFALLAAAACLVGCSSAMQSLAVSNATPASMNITTTPYRGQSCEALARQLDMFRKELAQPGVDELGRKSWGWHADAVQTVQNDQGCTPASAAAGRTVPTEMTMYFYCYVSEDIDRVNTRGVIKSQTSVFTNVFERSVTLTDPMHGHNLTKAFTDEFRLKVVPSYDLGKNTDPTCAFEDSAASASTMRQRMRDVAGIGISTTNIDVAWQPTVTVQAAVAAKPATTSTAKPGAPVDALTLGARLESVSAKAAKSAKLANANGAVVVAVTAGGPAARGGLKPRDIVTAISGQAVTRPEDVEAIVSELRGTKVAVKLNRGGKAIELAVQIAAAPAAVPVVAPSTPVSAKPRVAAAKPRPG